MILAEIRKIWACKHLFGPISLIYEPLIKKYDPNLKIYVTNLKIYVPYPHIKKAQHDVGLHFTHILFRTSSYF